MDIGIARDINETFMEIFAEELYGGVRAFSGALKEAGGIDAEECRKRRGVCLALVLKALSWYSNGGICRLHACLNGGGMEKGIPEERSARMLLKLYGGDMDALKADIPKAEFMMGGLDAGAYPEECRICTALAGEFFDVERWKRNREP